MAEREIKRLISREPWILNLLIARKPIIRRPFRLIYLEFLREVATDLRSRRAWSATVSGTIQASVIGGILALLRGGS